jgi:hypothetical protein
VSWRLSTGAVQPGPLALLSDDTLVFTDALGEAVAVRNAVVRWRARFGRGDAVRPAPLPLPDGGVVVATSRDLAALDVEGHERARTTLPEAAAGPLVAAPGRVLVTGASGGVWSWTPGAVEPVRVGSFGSPVEGGAVLTDEHTLVAVTSGGVKLSVLDLVQGSTVTRAVPAGGLWLGPPAVQTGSVYLMLLTPSAELAVGIDATGNETLRSRVASRTPAASTDGGAPPLVPVPHAPPLVDPSGTLAFASTEGGLGTVTGNTVEVLEGACAIPTARAPMAPSPPADTTRIAGLAPLPPAMFVAACHAGSLVALRGPTLAGESSRGHL